MSSEQKNITAYSLYNVQAKQRTKVNPLEDIYPELPDKKYQVIYADPPWDYGGKMQYDKRRKNARRQLIQEVPYAGRILLPQNRRDHFPLCQGRPVLDPHYAGYPGGIPLPAP